MCSNTTFITIHKRQPLNIQDNTLLSHTNGIQNLDYIKTSTSSLLPSFYDRTIARNKTRKLATLSSSAKV